MSRRIPSLILALTFLLRPNLCAADSVDASSLRPVSSRETDPVLDKLTAGLEEDGEELTREWAAFTSQVDDRLRGFHPGYWPQSLEKYSLPLAPGVRSDQISFPNFTQEGMYLTWSEWSLEVEQEIHARRFSRASHLAGGLSMAFLRLHGTAEDAVQAHSEAQQRELALTLPAGQVDSYVEFLRATQQELEDWEVRLRTLAEIYGDTAGSSDDPFAGLEEEFEIPKVPSLRHVSLPEGNSDVQVDIRLLVRSQWEDLMGIDWVHEDPWTREEWLALLEPIVDGKPNPQKSQVLVATYQEQILGSVVYQEFLGELRILKWQLHPSAQGRGVEEQMLYKLINKMVPGQLNSILMNIPESGSRLLDLFVSVGFKAQGVEFASQTGASEDAYRMELALLDPRVQEQILERWPTGWGPPRVAKAIQTWLTYKSGPAKIADEVLFSPGVSIGRLEVSVSQDPVVETVLITHRATGHPWQNIILPPQEPVSPSVWDVVIPQQIASPRALIQAMADALIPERRGGQAEPVISDRTRLVAHLSSLLAHILQATLPAGGGSTELTAGLEESSILTLSDEEAAQMIALQNEFIRQTGVDPLDPVPLEDFFRAAREQKVVFGRVRMIIASSGIPIATVAFRDFDDVNWVRLLELFPGRDYKPQPGEGGRETYVRQMWPQTIRVQGLPHALFVLHPIRMLDRLLSMVVYDESFQTLARQFPVAMAVVAATTMPGALSNSGLEEKKLLPEKQRQTLAAEWEQGMAEFQQKFRALHKGDWWDKWVDYMTAEVEPPEPPFTQKQLERIPRPLGHDLRELLYDVGPGVRDLIRAGDLNLAGRNVAEAARIAWYIRVHVGHPGLIDPWVNVTVPEYRGALKEFLAFLKSWQTRLEQLTPAAGLEENLMDQRIQSGEKVPLAEVRAALRLYFDRSVQSRGLFFERYLETAEWAFHGNPARVWKEVSGIQKRESYPPDAALADATQALLERFPRVERQLARSEVKKVNPTWDRAGAWVVGQGLSAEEVYETLKRSEGQTIFQLPSAAEPSGWSEERFQSGARDFLQPNLQYALLRWPGGRMGIIPQSMLLEPSDPQTAKQFRRLLREAVSGQQRKEGRTQLLRMFGSRGTSRVHFQVRRRKMGASSILLMSVPTESGKNSPVSLHLPRAFWGQVMELVPRWREGHLHLEVFALGPRRLVRVAQWQEKPPAFRRVGSLREEWKVEESTQRRNGRSPTLDPKRGHRTLEELARATALPEILLQELKKAGILYRDQENRVPGELAILLQQIDRQVHRASYPLRALEELLGVRRSAAIEAARRAGVPVIRQLGQRQRLSRDNILRLVLRKKVQDWAVAKGGGLVKWAEAAKAFGVNEDDLIHGWRDARGRLRRTPYFDDAPLWIQYEGQRRLTRKGFEGLRKTEEAARSRIRPDEAVLMDELKRRTQATRVVLGQQLFNAMRALEERGIPSRILEHPLGEIQRIQLVPRDRLDEMFQEMNHPTRWKRSQIQPDFWYSGRTAARLLHLNRGSLLGPIKKGKLQAKKIFNHNFILGTSILSYRQTAKLETGTVSAGLEEMAGVVAQELGGAGASALMTRVHESSRRFRSAQEPATRPLALVLEGLLDREIVASLGEMGWQVDQLPAGVSEEVLLLRVSDARSRWDGPVLVVVKSAWEESLKRLTARGQITGVILDPGFPSDILLSFLNQVLSLPGHVFRLEYGIRSGLEESYAVSTQL